MQREIKQWPRQQKGQLQVGETKVEDKIVMNWRVQIPRETIFLTKSLCTKSQRKQQPTFSWMCLSTVTTSFIIRTETLSAQVTYKLSSSWETNEKNQLCVTSFFSNSSCTTRHKEETIINWLRLKKYNK